MKFQYFSLSGTNVNLFEHVIYSRGGLCLPTNSRMNVLFSEQCWTWCQPEEYLGSFDAILYSQALGYHLCGNIPWIFMEQHNIYIEHDNIWYTLPIITHILDDVHNSITLSHYISFALMPISYLTFSILTYHMLKYPLLRAPARTAAAVFSR